MYKQTLSNIRKQVQACIDSDFAKVHATVVGLSREIGYIFISDDAIAVSKQNLNNFEYYGGFQYVNKNHRIEVVDYVFFDSNSDRVQGVIDAYNLLLLDE